MRATTKALLISFRFYSGRVVYQTLKIGPRPKTHTILVQNIALICILKKQFIVVEFAYIHLYYLTDEAF